MSTGLRQTLADAVRNAQAFRSMFTSSMYERWEFAGSVRRKKAECGDCEHVLIPRFGEVATGDGLFKETKTANLLWNRMDALVARGLLKKHVYGETGFRYGDRYRGVELDGVLHEVFVADEKNWGNTLLIRTGPAQFSKRVVDVFKNGGMYRQSEGYLRLVSTGEIVPVPDEETYFRLAGIRWTEPEDR